jgi:glycosyltransferase involved in cell wall biosynthesis
VRVCCLFAGDTPVANNLRDGGIEVTDLRMTGKARIDALWRLYRIVRTWRPVILHAWLFHAALASRLVGRLAGTPIVISSRRDLSLEGTFREPINRLTARFDDRTIAVSEEVRRVEIDASRSRPEKVVTIYNGIEIEGYREANPEAARELRRALRLDGEARIVGSVARLHPKKGFEYLLRAAPRIIERAPDTVFVVVGDGPNRKGLENLAREIGVSEHVVFTGDRTDVAMLLSGMDIFVLPSLYEGIPNAVLEAMASALPVVGTASGGTIEVIDDGSTGHLVPPADSLALADAILALLRDPARARAMGRAGRDRVASAFKIETTVAKTEALYEELLTEKLGVRFEKRADSESP